jgi:hypothetical protein
VKVPRPAVLLGALLLAAPGCKEDSYALVSVLTLSGTLTGVAQFRVYVDNGDDSDTLYYPRQPTESLALDPTHAVTFSVEFASSRGGETTFGVEPLAVDGSVLAYGEATVAIEKEKVFKVEVWVVPGTVRPVRGIDGGLSGDGGSTSLACDPYQPALACGTGQTCGLLCSADQPAVGMCYAAGPALPGQTCASNNDCSPGSQCFTFSAVGCQVMTCLRFCTSGAACGETGAYCNVPIECGSDSFTACSRPCDPTGSGTGGCAAGLGCFVYSDETTDCACPGLGTLGAACTRNQGCSGEAGCAGCAAGLSCVFPTGAATETGVCRPICALDVNTPTCPTGTTCHPFANSTQLRYGFCE